MKLLATALFITVVIMAILLGITQLIVKALRSLRFW